jgi:hypothetical protein
LALLERLCGKDGRKACVQMEVHLFMSKSREVFGFTANFSGANLPVELGPWEQAGGVTNHNWLRTEVTDALKRDGFYLLSRPENPADGDL